MSKECANCELDYHWDENHKWYPLGKAGNPTKEWFFCETCAKEARGIRYWTEFHRDRIQSNGCCLHIMLEDGNVERRHAEFCRDWAREHDHTLCAKIAGMLIKVSDELRKEIVWPHD